FREGIQARLDRFFYRDRLDYRRTLIEFGRTLTNEVRLEPMLGSVMDRLSQTLLVDRLAIFVEDPLQPGQMRLARSLGGGVGRAVGSDVPQPDRAAGICTRSAVFRVATDSARSCRFRALHARAARSQLLCTLPHSRAHRRRTWIREDR